MNREMIAEDFKSRSATNEEEWAARVDRADTSYRN